MRAVHALLPLLAACGGDTSIVEVPNEAPTVSITSPPDGSEYDEDTLVAFAAMVDDDRDPNETLYLIWQSDIDGQLEDGTVAQPDGTVTFVTANLTPGNHAITLTVVDSEAEEASDIVELTIIDVPDAPEITILHPVAGEYGIEDEAFEFEAFVSDEQDAPEDMLVYFASDHPEVDGDFCEATPDVSGRVSCDFALPVGDHFVELEVVDMDGFTAMATAYFEVIPGTAVDDDGDGWTENQGDCDDTDSSVHPTAPEVLNDVDDDCDGTVDEGTVGYDDDGDTWTELDGDCDDADADTYPGATEQCDGTDNDCDGTVDEDTVCYDDDGDCFCEGGSCTGSVFAGCKTLAIGDCDDNDADSHPGGTEVADAADNDCDGTIDEGTTAYDDDGDCYCESGTCQGSTDVTCGTVSPGDCNDGNDDISPGETELCNGIDDDCDGSTDESDAADASTWYRDADSDGYGSPSSSTVNCYQPTGYVSNSSDCDDSDSSRNPTTYWYQDSDGDGYGSASYWVQQCTQPSGYVSNSSDCSDSRSSSYPGATEYCNGYDDDCDGSTDENSAVDASRWYRDYDGDGYGSSTSTMSCYQPTGYVANSSDCYDYNADAYPSSTTYWRVNRGDGSYDYDCDGSQSKYYTSTYSCSTDWDGFSCDSYTNGWSGSVPSCGSTGSYRTGCSASFWSCSYSSSSTYYQYCK